MRRRLCNSDGVPRLWKLFGVRIEGLYDGALGAKADHRGELFVELSNTDDSAAGARDHVRTSKLPMNIYE